MSGSMHEHDLAARLKADADRESPAFSAATHERLMRAVRAADPPRASAEVAAVAPSGRTWTVRVAAGLALAATVAAAVYTLRPDPKPVAELPTPRTASAAPPAPPALLTRLWDDAGPMQAATSRLADGRLAYLDQDAIRFARFIQAAFPATQIDQTAQP